MNSTAPIERLNYFNGQRLDAADLRVEQDFHMRIRRLLNQSLFTPGIAAGLEVEEVLPEPAHAVRVLAGLALDSLGREIILVEPSAPIPVAGRPTEPTDPVTGNYLVIEYAEEATAFAGDGCAVRLGVTCKATEDLAWGAPSRIRAVPRIYIQHDWPRTEPSKTEPAENKIVLAQLALNKDCSVREIRKFVRKYVAASKPATASGFALEGEKDLDAANPKNLYFTIVGGAPNSATLFLRGARFSSLYYTELGKHSHDVNLSTNVVPGLPKHTHTLDLGKLTTTEEPGHAHRIDIGLAHSTEGDGIELDPKDAVFQVTGDDGTPFGDRLNFRVLPSRPHRHNIEGASVPTTAEAALPDHSHTITGQKTIETGANTAAQTGRDPRTFLNDLHVQLDGKDRTLDVLKQLVARDGPGSWPKLGTGVGGTTDRLSAEDANGRVEGTGEIDLLRLDKVDLTPGEHWIKLSVPAGGGKIQYNLYIA